MTDLNLTLLGGAHVHLPDHLRHIGARGWRITQVHDRDVERRDRLCAELDAAPLDDPGAITTKGAVVCSETAHHESDIAAALTAGVPTFSEKPLAGSAAAARRLAQLAETTGTLLHTGYFMRTNTALQRLRDAIRSDLIGEVIHARMRFSHDGGFADWLDLDCWMTDPSLACYGGFVDEAVHVIDALQWIVGPISGGAAAVGNALGYAVDDHGAAAIGFGTGATGVVEAGWTDARMRLEIDIVGREGTARLFDGHAVVTRRGKPEPVMTADLAPLDAGEGIVPFLDALEGNENEALVPPWEAAGVNAIIDAMDLGLRQP